MEKPVDDKGNTLASEYVEHHHAHSSHDMEVKHHSKEHEDEVVDGEDKEKSTSHDAHDDGKAGSDHASQDIYLLHEKHASSSKDAGVSHALSEKMDTDVHVAHGNEDTGMIHEHEGTSATHEKQEHNIERPSLAHKPVEVSSHGKHASHNMDADITHELIEKLMSHEKVVHDHDVSAVTHEHVEKSTTLEKATHDDKPVGPAHESGERHKTHEKAMHDDEHVGLVHEYGDRQHTDNAQNIKDLQEMQERPTTHDQVTHVCTDMDLALQAKHTQNNELGHAPHASEKQSPVGREHRSDVENGNRHHTPRDKSPEHGDDAGVAHEHGHKPRCDVLCANTSQEHDEKCRSVEDECESKKAFSDENSSRERVLFSRGSTPDVDTPTQPISSPFSNTKPSKAGLKGLGNAERGPGSTDGNLETPSTSWAFSVRASIAPSKFDHMATLRITYAAYKESNQGKEGVKLSLTQCCETK